MDKENVPPLFDGNQIIECIGVSKRLGNNVLQELEQRANNFLPGVSSEKSHLVDLGQNSGMKKSISMKFQDTHDKRFQGMDSIDTHYSLAKLSSMPETPGKRKNESDVPETLRESESICDSSFSSPGSTKKKQKPEEPMFSPVTDITHRLRRLRVRITTPSERERTERDRRRNIISNTPLSRQRQIHENIPTFAQPTATSLKRKQMNNPIHKLLAGNTADTTSQTNHIARPKPRHGDIFRNLNQSKTSAEGRPEKPPQLSLPKNNTSIPRKEQPRLPQSKSVFERLYEQSTISRSSSSKNLQKQGTSLPSSNLPRSKTHHDLNGSLKNTRLPKSTTLQNVSLDRPQWR
ncbi:unnamed protein product [Kluyveromyces dobzhanskii CBS 2104]|uniref:WGS project CCBQ000000000 data, contig 00012 n=1 Tax=Kluyveromyces dobzhanskii CBS 2104 TaxID=1427455 RepID=A0A0A8L2Z5_9SACH|nr:unnamed protein product [Kluyveromyces dobzhanskii CBS 2104]